MDADSTFPSDPQTVTSAEIRDRIRSSWTQCANLEEFANLARLSSQAVKVLEFGLQISSPVTDFQTWLEKQADQCMHLVQMKCQSQNLHGIKMMPFPSPDELAGGVVSVFPDLLDINWQFDSSKTRQYHQLLLKALPKAQPQTNNQMDAVIRAFYQQNLRRDAGRRIYRRIVDYFRAYDPIPYLSPFTSIIGRSGIGKSYLMKQLAYDNCTYVVYACLAKRAGNAYPGRSFIADTIASHYDRRNMTIFFECYIAASLVHVKICKNLGITPAGFFYLQVQMTDALGHAMIELVRGINELYLIVTQELIRLGKI